LSVDYKKLHSDLEKGKGKLSQAEYEKKILEKLQEDFALLVEAGRKISFAEGK